jgi:hypothetical protein
VLRVAVLVQKHQRAVEVLAVFVIRHANGFAGVVDVLDG